MYVLAFSIGMEKSMDSVLAFPPSLNTPCRRRCPSQSFRIGRNLLAISLCAFFFPLASLCQTAGVTNIDSIYSILALDVG